MVVVLFNNVFATSKQLCPLFLTHYTYQNGFHTSICISVRSNRYVEYP